MANRASQPALYEKIRSRQGSLSAPLPSRAPVPAPPVPPPSVPVGNQGAGGGRSWLAPGQTIKLPVGYILLGAGLILALLAATYVLGVRRGTQHERVRVDQQIISEVTGVTDPLVNLEPAGSIAAGRAGLPTGAPRVTGMTGLSSQASWGPVMPAKDPRQRGISYFILAETNETGAHQLADFCRAQGLETYVVSGKNERRRVVAYPGFDLKVTSRTSQEVTALRDRIYQVGERWSRSGPGRSNLRDAYLSSYDG